VRNLHNHDWLFSKKVDIRAGRAFCDAPSWPKKVFRFRRCPFDFHLGRWQCGPVFDN